MNNICTLAKTNKFGTFCYSYYEGTDLYPCCKPLNDKNNCIIINDLVKECIYDKNIKIKEQRYNILILTIALVIIIILLYYFCLFFNEIFQYFKHKNKKIKQNMIRLKRKKNYEKYMNNKMSYNRIYEKYKIPLYEEEEENLIKNYQQKTMYNTV